MVSHGLSWNCHVDYVIKKANTRLYALRILKKAGLSQSELVNIYCSFIRSSIEYASPAWSSLTVYLSGVIESIQKWALRIIYPDTSFGGALICTGLETLSTRRDNLCIKCITKLKSEDVDYNPLACITRREPKHSEHNYYLRTQSTNKFITDRFGNFVTVKYV